METRKSRNCTTLTFAAGLNRAEVPQLKSLACFIHLTYAYDMLQKSFIRYRARTGNGPIFANERNYRCNYRRLWNEFGESGQRVERWVNMWVCPNLTTVLRFHKFDMLLEINCALPHVRVQRLSFAKLLTMGWVPWNDDEVNNGNRTQGKCSGWMLEIRADTSQYHQIIDKTWCLLLLNNNTQH